MDRMRSIVRIGTLLLTALAPLCGCAEKERPYGTEYIRRLPNNGRAVWAVAPALNISGQREVDPLLQADLLYEQVQQVRGLTVVPVNRVVEVYVALGIEQVNSAEQAALVCDLLGCDALLVPTITAYDPYNPPKLGASLHLFTKPGTYARPANVDPRELARAASPPAEQSLQGSANAPFLQAVGIYDAANGSVREALFAYAAGRNDPAGPMGAREYLVSMDRYCGFVYQSLTGDLIRSMRRRR
jgi:hypothetical protein